MSIIAQAACLGFTKKTVPPPAWYGANIYADFDADVLSGNDGDRLLTWNSRVNGRSMTSVNDQSNPPFFKPVVSDGNGHNAVRFTDVAYQNGMALPTFSSLPTGLTMAVVFIARTTTNAYLRIWNGNTNTLLAPNRAGLNCYNEGVVNASAGACPMNTILCAMMTIGETNTKYFLNNADLTVTNNLTTMPSKIGIGAFLGSPYGEAASADVIRSVVWDKEFGSTERTDFYNAMVSKYF